MTVKSASCGGAVNGLIMLTSNFEIPVEPPVLKLNNLEINGQFIDYHNLKENIETNMEFNGIDRFNNFPLGLELHSNLNHLTFYFSAEDWVAPHRIRYSYKMEGLIDKWSPLTLDTKVDYRSLPYGTYTFNVRAIGAAQKWSDILKYTFIIKSPWWATWWARIGYGITALLLVFSYVRWRTSNLKQRHKELLRAKEKAEESDRLKSAFLTNMSHEIRTPMNGILGFANLLKEPGLTGEKQKEYIRIIEKSGDRMLNTINDIMDISIIESGQVNISISEVNINEQTENLFLFFKPEAEKKGLQLSLNNSLVGKEAIIETDLEKVYSILSNLIKNALKYTSEGDIEFGYNLKINNASFNLEFFVKDTGIGIQENRQSAIFERFVQADIEDKMALEGSGLGLSIAKAYAEMLGGKIWVESKVGVGSQFYFTIPYISMKKEIPESTEQEYLAKPTSKIKKLKILIVEDEKISELYLATILEKFKKEILYARTGAEALEHCRMNTDIDLVLMDIRMPDMDGYEATRRIREFNKDVIIIAQTAFAEPGDREKALETGCDDYITKPINKKKLYTIINKTFAELT